MLQYLDRALGAVERLVLGIPLSIPDPKDVLEASKHRGIRSVEAAGPTKFYVTLYDRRIDAGWTITVYTLPQC